MTTDDWNLLKGGERVSLPPHVPPRRLVGIFSGSMVPYELFFYEYSDLGPASERLLAGDAKWLGPWIVGYAVSGLEVRPRE